MSCDVTTPPCQCSGPAPFDCPVLKMRMGPNAHRLCRTHQGWRAKMMEQAAGVMGFVVAAPGIAGKARRLTAAVRKWIAAGRPVRTPERVQEIFDTICKPCQHFIAGRRGRGKCGLCGCPLKRRGLAGKIEMKTEGCPIGKWKSGG